MTVEIFNQLRYENLRVKKVYILTLLALVFAVLLFVGGIPTDDLRSFRYIWGMGHLFCFALWAYLYLNCRPKQSFKQQLFAVLVLTFFLGGMIELIQAEIGREASWQDFGNNLVGGTLAVAFFAKSRKNIPAWQLKLLQIPILFIALWSLLPTGKVIIDDVIARQQFPLLSGFETSLEETRWSGSAKRKVNNDISIAGTSSLQIKLTTQRYSGIGLKHFPKNWDKFSAVSLQIFNPDPEPLLLHFRIHDQHHRKFNNIHADRYNASFKVLSGWNQLQVSLDNVAQAPKDRLLDLSRIAGMGLFVGKLDQSRIIYIDEVKLIP